LNGIALATGFMHRAENKPSVARSPREGGNVMNVQHYREVLVDLEKTLSRRRGGAAQEAREQFLETAHDLGDASVADEVAAEKFTEAQSDSELLNQVRDALARIQNGTVGRCAVDGGPIEAARLDAVPWTPYCLKHEQQFERSASKPSTL
jgi:DnaK suppressor protein